MSDRVGDQMPAPKQVPKRPPLPTDFVWKGMCAICNREMELPFYPQIGMDATCQVCSKEVREELERVTKEALLEMGHEKLDEWIAFAECIRRVLTDRQKYSEPSLIRISNVKNLGTGHFRKNFRK